MSRQTPDIQSITVTRRCYTSIIARLRRQQQVERTELAPEAITAYTRSYCFTMFTPGDCVIRSVEGHAPATLSELYGYLKREYEGEIISVEGGARVERIAG